MARLAIFEGTFDTAEISRRYEQWTKIRHLDRDVNRRVSVRHACRGFCEQRRGNWTGLEYPQDFSIVKAESAGVD